MKTPRRILFIKPSSLGDVVHALPVVSAIHRHWPDAELRWLIQPPWRSLVEGHPGVSSTILFPREKFRGPRGWIRSVAWMRVLRDWKPDLAIDLQGLFRSALFARISGAAVVMGLSDAREGSRFLHGASVPVSPSGHAVDRYLTLLDNLGIPAPRPPEFLLPPGTLPRGFENASGYILLHPYARGRGKSLGPELVRAFVLGASAVPGVRVVIAGRGGGIPGLHSCAEDWTNRTDLSELIGLLRGASFIVSSDSGPMHLASAVNPAATLGIHLWSDPLKVGPYAPQSLVWKGGRLSRVEALDDRWRAPSAAPTEAEMEELGRRVAEKSI